MFGREAYHRPFVLSELHHALYPDEPTCRRHARSVLDRMARYAHKGTGKRRTTCPPSRVTCWVSTVVSPARGSIAATLSEGAREVGAGPELIRAAPGRRRRA